jgi:hypothetical protein
VISPDVPTATASYKNHMSNMSATPVPVSANIQTQTHFHIQNHFPAANNSFHHIPEA